MDIASKYAAAVAAVAQQYTEMQSKYQTHHQLPSGGGGSRPSVHGKTGLAVKEFSPSESSSIKTVSSSSPQRKTQNASASNKTTVAAAVAKDQQAQRETAAASSGLFAGVGGGNKQRRFARFNLNVDLLSGGSGENVSPVDDQDAPGGATNTDSNNESRSSSIVTVKENVGAAAGCNARAISSATKLIK
uniref:Uncharacterized protein n=1 Tax=Romanomermis culicivorax TaxID=13658 RepID=A0A915JBU8_ROMCU